MLARTHIRRARCRRYHDEKQRDLHEKASAFLLFAFRLRFMLHLSVCSYERVLQWPYHELFRDPNSALYIYESPRTLYPSLSLFLYRIRWSNGNSELYVRIYVCMRARVCVRVRAWRNNTCIRGVFFVVGTKTRSARCILCVCGRHQDWALSRTNQMIVSRSPSPLPSLSPPVFHHFSLLLFCASTYSESAYVQSLQSLRHWW